MPTPADLATAITNTESLGLNADEIVNDLRLRVLDGEDLENDPETYLLIINKIRQNRRTANALSENKKAAKAKTSIKTSRRLTAEERDKLLNEELF